MDATENQNRHIRVIDELAEKCQRIFLNFLENFKVDDELKYVESAKKMNSLDKMFLGVSFKDLMTYDSALSQDIMLNFQRLYPFLCQATQIFINKHIDELEINDRTYTCHFIDFPTLTNLRNLKNGNLGKLIKFRGQVIRSHGVHPELVLGTYKCQDCGTVVKNIEQQFIHTKPASCGNPQCMNRLKFELIREQSKFVDFQKVRVQETQTELPRGSIPRCMDVILRNELVECAQPGDQSEFIGCLITIPDISQFITPGSRTLEKKPIKISEGYDNGVTGLKQWGRSGMTYRLAFLANHVVAVNNKYLVNDDMNDGVGELTYDSLMKRLTEQEVNKVLTMSQDVNLVKNMCDCLFPTTYGNDEVKRGLLLMLFGGVQKVTEEGTKLRGDINICIVGDPSTAKSQFLKRIAGFSPRSVYTSGKASTAAGLTAAVVKDQENGEFVIEAGAMILANNGVCCIDEFDKMDVRDQVAIHEAMEQQTISITKAGIKASLNAKTSVLAAANPIGGRYDRSRSLRQNISLSAPIMSRFDLFFVLIDECTEQVDYEIAKRITESQRPITTETADNRLYNEDDIQRYITFARCFEPRLTEDAYKLMVKEYWKMRERDAASGSRSAWRITVRQLESLVRLSEATARMRFSDFVEQCDVIEAHRLLSKSIIRVEQPDINLSAETVNTNANNTDAADGLQAATDDQSQTITFDEYHQITGQIISHLRAVEIDNEEEFQLRKSELVEWYLSSIIENIADEDVLLQKKQMIEMIIHRLIEKDNILMAVYRTESLGGEINKDDPILFLHPNVAAE